MLLSTIINKLGLAVAGGLALSVAGVGYAAVWAPGSVEEKMCTASSYRQSNTSVAAHAHAAFTEDCWNMAAWAEANKGMWVTGTGGDGAWNTLSSNGSCSLLIQNSGRTDIGSGDVAALVDDVVILSPNGVFTSEWTGNFECGRGTVSVHWWLQASKDA